MTFDTRIISKSAKPRRNEYRKDPKKAWDKEKEQSK